MAHLSALDLARDYLVRGMSVLPIEYKGKRPFHNGRLLTGWQHLKLTINDLPSYFNGQPQNIGVLLGEASGGLIDIDLDCPETVILADAFLPQTGAIFGRASKRRSHYLYYSNLATKKFHDPLLESHADEAKRKKATLVEIRSTGAQTVFPGSVHPSGEPVTWDSDNSPSKLEAEIIEKAVRHLAAAALLARYWPSGARNDAANALAGGLLRAGWTTQQIERFIEAICRVANDEETRARLRNVIETSKKLDNGSHTTGWPTLAKIIDKRIVDRICEWLSIRHVKESEQQNSSVNAISWPTLEETALLGLAGDFVRLIEPHSESDPAALLMQFLAAYGNCIGRTAHFVVEADKHYMNLFAVLVGSTSSGRKGTSWGQAMRPFESVDEQWARGCIASGLSSGEGLINAVRDEDRQEKPIKAGGKSTGIMEVVVTDAGVSDKRSLVFEGEFASVLRVQGREGNTLSAVIRQAWDTGNLRSLVKNAPIRATDAHISIIGHITRGELERCLDDTEAVNGYVNRFLWLCVRRSKYLPEGGRLQDENFAPFLRRLREAIEFGKSVGEMKRDEEARELWCQNYARLVDGHAGLFGAITARAVAQVLRLSCLYALLDLSASVRREHLEAALALWSYAESSARFIFGERTGDKVADEILRALREAESEGRTQTELNNLFHGHRTSGQITNALNSLVEAGLIFSREEATGGRPTRRWLARLQPAEKAKKAEKGHADMTGQETNSAFSAYSASAEEQLTDEESELAARLEYMEGLPRDEAERRAREWQASSQ
jgi:hypothetical protein